jgi:hypothetical protein
VGVRTVPRKQDTFLRAARIATEFMKVEGQFAGFAIGSFSFGR